MIIQTWFKEQLILAVCLAPGMAVALAKDHTWQNVLRVALGFAFAIYTQKIRGTAARKTEAHLHYLRVVGVNEKITLSCEVKIARWAVIAQWLGIMQAMVTAPSWTSFFAALPAIAFVQCFALYRRMRSNDKP